MMPKRTDRRVHRDHTFLPVLFALGKGAVVITAILASSGAKASQHKAVRRWGYRILEDAEGIRREDLERFLAKLMQRHRLADAIRLVRRRRFVRLRNVRGKHVLEITERGRRHLVHYALDQLRIAPQDHWDGIWRIILFDIPERQRVGRDVFRKKLRDLGFFSLQKSAFVLPYPCHDEIDFIIQSYGLAPYVTFFEAAGLGYQGTKALAHFRLRR